MKLRINGKDLILDKIEFDFIFNSKFINNNIIAWTIDPLTTTVELYLDNI
jgi:hypothetical protein